VRRQGLEPRTRGLRVDRWAAADALPARIAHVNAPKAPTTRACDRRSFHEPFHDLQGPAAQDWSRKVTGQPPANRRALGSAGCAAVREAIRRSGAEVARWPRITLRVSSALEKIGPTAAVSPALADARISCNVVAGAAHDHLFVDWLGDIALALIRQL